MDTIEIRSVLQDLIIRLKDAEEGFTTIANGTRDVKLEKWCRKFAEDRHEMHSELEEYSQSLSGDPTVKTSILGEMHRLFINFKLNFVDSDIPGLVDEIERGASKLLKDYENALASVELPTDILSTFISHKTVIEVELERMLEMKKNYLTPK
ncbi:PA2169 family four-helix-bundle protein [Portibacter lacus]|uniref:DUF2383 domain-containing protein n=1 Tax=Portibacter lacus TaxID=1099794 RepID=A0AA37SN73_9BACT|nr:PA2169 family four-helix-bundle protein [Portibacter lacus]GLR15723.1 hypothetical protein GCM10007940_03380 [Portibacter lacus]